MTDAVALLAHATALRTRRERGGGNALRAAVLGANDGLCSNLSLVMGMAGAAAANPVILPTGLAGLMAGACSMAMGEWLSVTSARELSEGRITAKSKELRANPELEREQLVEVYQAKGLETSAAHTVVDQLFMSRAAALDTLAREELGVDPMELGGSPWAAAISSFCLFALGAIFPVAPFIVAHGWPAILASLALSGLALSVLRAATGFVTGRSVVRSALRALLIGYAAAGVTFLVGRALGVTIG